MLGHNVQVAAGTADRDTFEFPGTPGERLRVLLDRDGAAGGTEGAATLLVTSHAGQQLAQRTGKLPLGLDVILADAGMTVVVREASADRPEPYRGSYILSVWPLSGAVGKRLLQPRNVEPSKRAARRHRPLPCEDELLNRAGRGSSSP